MTNQVLHKVLKVITGKSEIFKFSQKYLHKLEIYKNGLLWTYEQQFSVLLTGWLKIAHILDLKGRLKMPSKLLSLIILPII